jgi:hypothetical protein
MEREQLTLMEIPGGDEPGYTPDPFTSGAQVSWRHHRDSKDVEGIKRTGVVWDKGPLRAGNHSEVLWVIPDERLDGEPAALPILHVLRSDLRVRIPAGEFVLARHDCIYPLPPEHTMFANALAYVFEGDLHCWPCIREKFGYLEQLAAERGIDLTDEASYDSGDFPKAIAMSSELNNPAGDGDPEEVRWDHCGSCGDCLDHDRSDCEEETT